MIDDIYDAVEVLPDRPHRTDLNGCRIYEDEPYWEIEGKVYCERCLEEFLEVTKKYFYIY